MAISVARAPPGDRPAPHVGATRMHIGIQFLGGFSSALVLGGAAGIALGTAGTAGYTALQGWGGLGRSRSVSVAGQMGITSSCSHAHRAVPAIRWRRGSPRRSRCAAVRLWHDDSLGRPGNRPGSPRARHGGATIQLLGMPRKEARHVCARPGRRRVRWRLPPFRVGQFRTRPRRPSPAGSRDHFPHKELGR